MRTIGDVVKDARTGKKPEYDEMRYTIVALHALMCFDRNAFMDLFRGELERREGRSSGIKFDTIYSPEWQANERIRRMNNTYSKTPKEYVGASYDPDDPNVAKRIEAAEKLADYIISRGEKPKEG